MSKPSSMGALAEPESFAQISMQDVKTAISELDRSVNQLGLMGAMIEDLEKLLKL